MYTAEDNPLLLYSDLELANLANIDLDIATDMIDNYQELTLLDLCEKRIKQDMYDLQQNARKISRLINKYLANPELTQDDLNDERIRADRQGENTLLLI